MDQRNRNIAVGLTVIVALVILAGMIVLFTGLPQAFQGGYELNIRLPSTGGAQAGDVVHLSGIPVGRIIKVGFVDPNDPRNGVNITARINANVRLPGNTVAQVNKNLVGPPYVELKPEGERRYDPETGEPIDFLAPEEAPLTVQGTVRGGDTMEQLRPAMDSLAKLADTIEKLIAPGEAATATEPAGAPGSLRQIITKLNRTLDGLEKLVGDEQLRTDMKSAMHNLAEAAEKMKEAMQGLEDFAKEATATAQGADAKLDKLTAGLIDAAGQISKLMDTFNRIAIQAEKGTGTAGKMLNDPQLYANLEAATAELTRVLADFDELVNEWRKEGLKLR